MRRKVTIVLASFIGLLAVGLRYAPLDSDTYRDVAHYAVAVRKFSSCEKGRSSLDELRANAAYWMVSWNHAGYNSYTASGRRLLLYTVGKLKCGPDKPRFQIESDRAIRAIELALERGEDIDQLNANGDNALHMAVTAGNHLIVEFLLNSGASLEAKNSDGETAMDIVKAMVVADIGYDPTKVEPLLLAHQ